MSPLCHHLVRFVLNVDNLKKSKYMRRIQWHKFYERLIIWNKMKPKETGCETGIPCGPWTS
jgi:hypothetical protein